MNTYKVKVTYTATFETEIKAPAKNLALVFAGKEFAEMGIEDDLTSYGAVLSIKRVACVKPLPTERRN